MKILISGFGVFGTHTENSSETMANMFRELNDPNIETIVLPVTFAGSFDVIKEKIDSFKPDYILNLGIAGGRNEIGLEKVGINLIHAKIPDNAGAMHLDQLINENGPAAYFSTLPLEKMREVPTPIPVEMSFSAGTYVCNYLMYRVLDYTKDTKIKAGFIHLPPINNNQDQMFNSLKDMMKVFA